MIGNHIDLIILSLIYTSHCELKCEMMLSSSRSLKEALDMLNVFLYLLYKRIGKEELYKLI